MNTFGCWYFWENAQIRKNRPNVFVIEADLKNGNREVWEHSSCSKVITAKVEKGRLNVAS